MTHCEASDRWAVGLGGALAAVRARIAAALARAGRESGTVRVVAVTKEHPAAAIEAARAAGLLEIGENRVQEALRKKEELGAAGDALRWHLIGHLQRNKVRQAWDQFALIHSVDSVELAELLSRRGAEAGRPVAVLLQVNVAGEASKHGFSAESLLAGFGRLWGMPGLEIRGLMTMAPWVERAEVVRPVFRGLRLLRDRVEREHGAALPELSMGMSGDFEVAVEEGATLVRLGTVLFGARR